MTAEHKTSALISPINNLTVRLTVAGQPVGSGFVVVSDYNENCYVLTARHCIANLKEIKEISIDWYDYDERTFKSLQVDLDTYPPLFYGSNETYDGAILVMPRLELPVWVEPVVLVSHTGPDQPFRFRGFPDALSNEHPEELDATAGLSLGHQIKLKVPESVEDNTTIAYANVKGFSGSGLFRQENKQIYVAGIITDYQVGIKRFIAHSLNPLNELLRANNLPELNILGASLTNSTGNQVDAADFVDQCRRLLDEAEQAWEDLRPRQGVNIVRAVRNNLIGAVLSTDRRNLLLARVSYLEALIAGDLREEVDVDKLFIEANALAPDVLSYQERAANAYLNKKQPDKAYEIAETILKTQPFNPYAWLIIAHLEPSQPAPPTVQAEPAFKVGYLTTAGKLKGDGTVRTTDYKDLFRSEIADQELPNSISRRRIYYWSYVAQFTLHDLLTRLKRIHNIQGPKELRGNAQLKYAHDLLERICQRVESSDLRNDKFFQVIRFEFCYCRYYLTDDAATADYMAQQLFELFVGTKQVAALPYLPNRPAAIEAIPHRLMDLLQILFGQQEGQKMLDVINADKIYSNEPILDLFKGMAYGLINDSEKQVESFQTFLTRTDNLDDLDVINFLAPIQILLKAGISNESIQRLAIDNKSFDQPYYKPLLEAFLWAEEQGPKDRARTCAEHVKEHWSVLPDLIRMVLPRVYLQLGDWSVAKELLAQLCNEEVESEELLLFTMAIYYERREIARFLQLAGNWRAKFTPHSGLIRDELSVYQSLRNWVKMEEVAIYGLTHFPDSVAYWFDLVRSLYSQGDTRRESLLAQLALDHHLFRDDFTPEARSTLIHICFTAGLVEKGLELSYRVLKANPNNPEIQQYYFSLSTNYQAFDNLDKPETAQSDMVVRLQLKDDIQLLELTEEAVRYNRVAKATIGLAVGESFKLHDQVMHRDEEYTVVQIMDKYSGQLAFIMKNSEQPFSGLAMRSMEIPTDEAGELDFNKFHQQLKELLGPEGTKQKIITDELRQKFAKGEIGFTELCQGAYGGDPVAAWNYATSDFASGFPLIPICLQSTASQSEGSEYVLDFTSMFTLFFLSKIRSINFEKTPFIVSQFLIDYVSLELETARNERGSAISEEILVDRITPHFHPEDQQQRKAIFYQELLDWIHAHCKPDYAPERLGSEFTDRDNEREIFPEDRAFMSSFSDTLLLANRPNRIWITDDSLPYRSRAGVALMTTEHFLHREYSQLYLDQLWLDLVGFNFRGLTLGADQLYRVFRDSLLEDANQKNYYRATFSFSKQYNPEPRLLIAAILFLKMVYKEPFSLDYKRQVSQALLRRHLTGVSSVTERGVLLIRLLIDREFELLGDLGNFLKEDLDIAIGLI
jgi:tetratricopeptide (TPR) repeat protein